MVKVSAVFFTIIYISTEAKQNWNIHDKYGVPFVTLLCTENLTDWRNDIYIFFSISYLRRIPPYLRCKVSVVLSSFFFFSFFFCCCFISSDTDKQQIPPLDVDLNVYRTQIYLDSCKNNQKQTNKQTKTKKKKKKKKKKNNNISNRK